MRTALLFFLCLSTPSAVAKIRIVTTLPSFADIARNVGGDEVDVTSLTQGTQDPHFVDAKPDLILYLSKAELLIRVGLGLEDGWLPPLVLGSRNGKIQESAQGNLDASTLMSLKDVPSGKLDRSQGDVHPGGNPHYMLDPRNGTRLARGIAERLGKLNAEKSSHFKERAEKYASELNSKILEWEKKLKPLRGSPTVTYHKSWMYFSDWVGLSEMGYVEPKPGTAPSPDHVVSLVKQIKEKKVKWILMEPFYPKGVAEDVASQTGAKLLVLPSEVKGLPQVHTYFGIFEKIVQILAGA